MPVTHTRSRRLTTHRLGAPAPTPVIVCPAASPQSCCILNPDTAAARDRRACCTQSARPSGVSLGGWGAEEQTHRVARPALVAGWGGLESCHTPARSLDMLRRNAQLPGSGVSAAVHFGGEGIRAVYCNGLG